jgi:predicted nucleic acid-binding protein
MRFVYVDSSVLVLFALKDPNRERKIRELLGSYDEIVTSELSGVEAQSGLSHQLDRQPRLLTNSEQNLNRILANVNLYAIDSFVLGHARVLVKRYRSSLGLRAMDSIHVATGNLFRESLGSSAQPEYLTADRRQHAVFTAEGWIGNCLA